MAPVVYFLNKSFFPNFKSTKKSVRVDGAQKSLSSPGSRASSRKEEYAIKSFHWLWTLPGAILVGCIVFGLTSSFYNVYANELPPSWLYTMADPDSKTIYFSQHMMRIWTHLAVFAMGILAGVECRRANRSALFSYRSSNIGLMSGRHHHGWTGHHPAKNLLSSSSSSLPVISSSSQNSDSVSQASSTVGVVKSNHKSDNTNQHINSSISIDILSTNYSIGSSSNENINSGSDSGLHYNNNNKNSDRWCRLFFEILGYLLAITTMTTIIFSTHDWSLNDLPKPLIAGMFDASSRFLWSMALIWILYMVSVPNKDRKLSLLARSLGHPGMVCLGKLSFLIYIIHPFVHTTVLAIQEQPIYSSWLMLFHILIGNLTITVILAFLVSIFVEMPCRNLFRRCGTSLLLTHQSTDGSATTNASPPTNTTKLR